MDLDQQVEAMFFFFVLITWAFWFIVGALFADWRHRREGRPSR